MSEEICRFELKIEGDYAGEVGRVRFRTTVKNAQALAEMIEKIGVDFVAKATLSVLDASVPEVEGL